MQQRMIAADPKEAAMKGYLGTIENLTEENTAFSAGVFARATAISSSHMSWTFPSVRTVKSPTSRDNICALARSERSAVNARPYRPCGKQSRGLLHSLSTTTCQIGTTQPGLVRYMRTGRRFPTPTRIRQHEGRATWQERRHGWPRHSSETIESGYMA